jgi:uncharacterized protein (DUF433 family)
MLLEDYFEFERIPTGRILIKGTRVAIEHILYEYLVDLDSAERIYHNHRRILTLEQVYATITYYLHNKVEVDGYLERVEAADNAAYQEYLKQEPPEVVKRLRALAAERRQEGAARTRFGDHVLDVNKEPGGVNP